MATGVPKREPANLRACGLANLHDCRTIVRFYCEPSPKVTSPSITARALELLVRTRTVRTARAQHALYYPVAPIAEGTPVASTDARCLFHALSKTAAMEPHFCGLPACYLPRYVVVSRYANIEVLEMWMAVGGAGGPPTEMP
jgi:hypothetical protein